mmetsp:Transcript_6579/g.13590  ORF Transcript_6579/g.13590 Transcript_6579/m.13590 type:complete len:547 (-) Transcript_6579:50-1690(-)
MLRPILPVLLLHAIRSQVHESCERDDCLKGEPENAVMLQAFADSKHYKNFARDVLQVSTQDAPITCSDIPEFYHAGGNACGRETVTACVFGNYAAPCWQIPGTCTVSDASQNVYYTVKWDNGTTPGPSVPITPPEDYICITATCTKSGAGQKCMVIDPRIPGGEVTLNSAGGDISNMRIQYACGSACPGSDPSSSTTSTTTGGGGGGDPHIQTIKGDSYTLTKQGNFLAFSFKGKEALVAPAPYGSGSPGSHSHGDGASRVPVDFELFVHYNDGRKSFTRGLLLLDHQNHQAMEMTSEDCRWRVRAGESDWKTLTEWRKSVSKSEVSSDLLYQRGNGAYVTGLNISRAENTFNLSKIEMNTFITGAERNFSGKTLKSYAKAIILINMNTPTGLTDVVKLKVKCYPGYHMNYRVGVYNGKDLRFVGGEVGGTSSEPKETPEFLQVGQGTIQMRSDSGFQYHQSWEELGGSASAALYLQDQDDSVAGSSKLMTTPCTKSDQQKAMEICRNAGLKDQTSLSFAECVFDVCRAGGDALPELTEISWHEDD